MDEVFGSFIPKCTINKQPNAIIHTGKVRRLILLLRLSASGTPSCPDYFAFVTNSDHQLADRLRHRASRFLFLRSLILQWRPSSPRSSHSTRRMRDAHTPTTRPTASPGWGRRVGGIAVDDFVRLSQVLTPYLSLQLGSVFAAAVQLCPSIAYAYQILSLCKCRRRVARV